LAGKEILERLRTLIKTLERQDAGKTPEVPMDDVGTWPSDLAPFEPPGSGREALPVGQHPRSRGLFSPEVKEEDGAGVKVFRARYPFGSLPGLSPVPSHLMEGLRSLEPLLPDPENWLFIDIETTGLSGAATFAFLVGLGKWLGDEFEVSQFFLPRRENEGAMLAEILRAIGEREERALVTFNGRCFDIPLLNSRIVFSGAGRPLSPRVHLDLLYLARSLGGRLTGGHGLKESVSRFTGRVRRGDIPSHMIPALYFIYEREGDISVLSPVFTHNRLDIVDMACLIRVWAETLTGASSEEGTGTVAASALEGAGRVHYRRGNLVLAQKCLEAAISCRESSLVPWDTPQREMAEPRRLLATVLRKRQDWERAYSIWEALISDGTANYEDYLWLARYYELCEKDLRRSLSLVLECIRKMQANGEKGPEALERRRRRLERLLV